MQLTPVIAIHMSAAFAAVALGPVALWARQGARPHPRIHRAFGHAWVTMMVVTATTAVFIRDTRLPNLAGYTPIHLLIPVALLALVGSFWKLARRDIAGHRRIMRILYFAACIVTGGFTLLPQRYLGHLLWSSLAPLAPIVRGTPAWVWALLAVLVLVGLTQLRDRSASLARISVLPLVMVGFSFGAARSVFGASPAWTPALAAWLAAATVLGAVTASLPTGAQYDPGTRRYALRGSVLPLLLLLAVFLVRYAVAVRLALHPALAADAAFALPAAAVYGAFSGVFAGQAVQLWKLALARTPGRSAAFAPAHPLP